MDKLVKFDHKYICEDDVNEVFMAYNKLSKEITINKIGYVVNDGKWTDVLIKVNAFAVFKFLLQAYIKELFRVIRRK